MTSSPAMGDDYQALALQMSAAAFSAYCHLEPDGWQARLLLSTAQRILVNASRQSGKSQTLATLALHTALYTPESMVLLVSPGLRQSGELFRKCLHLYRGLDRPVPADSETALTLSLENGSRIVALPGAEGTIRGYSAVNLAVCDESSRIPDELYYSVRPMLATVASARLICASTPQGARGWWHSAWVGGDGELWERYRVTADMVPRISREFLEQELRTFGPLYYRQEYECSFEASTSALFSEMEIQALFDERIEAWTIARYVALARGTSA